MPDLGSSVASILQIPGLQELVNNGITQQRQNMPLRTAINQQAVNMLPNTAFGRPDMAAIPQANYSTPAPSGGGGADWAKILGLIAAGVGGGGLLAKLLGKGNPSGGAPGSPGGGSSNLANLLNLFKRTPPTSNPYGDTTYSNNFDPFAFDPNDPTGGGVDYSQLPGFGTSLPETDPYQGLPGYGTPLPGAGSWPPVADPWDE